MRASGVIIVWLLIGSIGGMFSAKRAGGRTLFVGITRGNLAHSGSEY